MRHYRGKYIHENKNEKTEKWVIGLPINENYLITAYPNCPVTEIRIQPETLGIGSGRMDCENNEIFEGDILENKKGIRFEVRYGLYAMYDPFCDVMTENIGFFMVSDATDEFMPLGITEAYMKKIGNIHDNPEWRVK